MENINKVAGVVINGGAEDESAMEAEDIPLIVSKGFGIHVDKNKDLDLWLLYEEYFSKKSKLVSKKILKEQDIPLITSENILEFKSPEVKNEKQEHL